LLDRAVYYEIVSDYFTTFELETILCDGKFGVIRMLEHVRTRHGANFRALFFVDRDLEEFIDPCSPADPFLYVTDGYSIENHFVSPEAFRYVLTTILHIEADEASIDSYVSRFRAAYDQFKELLLPIMASVIWVKRLGGNVILANVRIQNIFSLDHDGMPHRGKRSLKNFGVQCSCTISIMSASYLKPIIAELQRKAHDGFVRGKFALWLFVRSIEHIKHILRMQRLPGEKATFLNAIIDESNLVQLLVRRIPPPLTLTAFLQNAHDTFSGTLPIFRRNKIGFSAIRSWTLIHGGLKKLLRL
jgi:hypothetical protein